jgi:hypothetical protein
MMVVDEQETRFETDGNSLYRIRNLIAWRPGRGSGYIEAVGAPETWNSNAPLAADVELSDLVELAVTRPDDAAKLWGPFLAYVQVAANSSRWRSFLSTLRMMLWRMNVRLDVRDSSTRAAIAAAIRKSPSFRFHVVRQPERSGTSLTK